MRVLPFLYKIFPGILLAVTVTSCGDDESNGPVNYFNPMTYQVSEMTYKPSFSSSNKRVYTYNLQNHCSKVMLVTPDQSDPWTQYHYDTAGILETSQGYNNQDYRYTVANGLVTVKGEYYNDVVSSENRYTYDSQNRLIKSEYWANHPLGLLQYETYQYNAAGNIIRSEVYNNSNVLTGYTLYTYDNKYNPYKNFWPKCDIDYYYPNSQNNILTRRIYTTIGDWTKDFKYNYTYDQNGVPTYSKETETHYSSNFLATFEKTYQLK